MSKKNKVWTFLETFVRRQVGFIPCIQLLIWIMFYLMMKLLLIALSDIFLRDSAFMKLLVLQGSFQTVINQRPVKFPSDMITNTLINTKDGCGGVANYDALVIVHTATHHFQHRLNYRDTYGNYLFTVPYRLKVVTCMSYNYHLRLWSLTG
ncbi:unnamed protein product [Lymnaea stagnalis]|uniref:Uncharacterized protein n=1 Tax=Lymnaea stagnalis TaxID=6523 RepID=A0AAV2HQP6_LYMST